MSKNILYYPFMIY